MISITKNICPLLNHWTLSNGFVVKLWSGNKILNFWTQECSNHFLNLLTCFLLVNSFLMYAFAWVGLQAKFAHYSYLNNIVIDNFVHFAFNNKFQIWVSLQSLNCCNAHSFNISGRICGSHFSLLYLYLFNWKPVKTIIILYIFGRETHNQHPMLSSFLIVTW